MNRVKTLMAGALSMGLVACAGQQRVVKAEDPPVVKVERLFPQPDSLDASKLLVKLSIGNPRASSVHVENISYTIDTGDVAGVIAGAVEVDSSVESEQLAEIEFEVEIPFPKDDPAAYLGVIAQGTVPLEVKGNATFSGLGDIAFERKGAVATPSMPKFIVHDAQAARYGKEGVDMTFFLRLVNENAFTVTVGEVNYSVEIYGKVLKEQSAGIGSTLVAGAAQEFEVSVVLEEKTFPGITKQLKSGKLEYRVFGKVSVDDIEEDFEHPGEIEIDLD